MQLTKQKTKKNRMKPELSLDVVTLTQQCIAIPSYVKGNVDETEFTNFLETILTAKKWPYIKQQFDGSRSNVLIGNSLNPKRIFWDTQTLCQQVRFGL
jgi:hypothetical protein